MSSVRWVYVQPSQQFRGMLTPFKQQVPRRWLVYRDHLSQDFQQFMLARKTGVRQGATLEYLVQPC